MPKVRIFLAALCAAWTQYLLTRAIADIAARSERDCRAVGLDRAEILAGLTQLHGAMSTDSPDANGRDPEALGYRKTSATGRAPGSHRGRYRCDAPDLGAAPHDAVVALGCPERASRCFVHRSPSFFANVLLLRSKSGYSYIGLVWSDRSTSELHSRGSGPRGSGRRAVCAALSAWLNLGDHRGFTSAPRAPMRANFRDWKSAAAGGRRSRFWQGQPRPCAPRRCYRETYTVAPTHSTTSHWMALG